MTTPDIFWGEAAVRQAGVDVSGAIVEIGGEKFYRVSDYDRMPPFLMSVVSSSDHWMFVSSAGGMTCGRENPDGALLPYDTDDKIHDAAAHTGPMACLLVEKAGRTCLWKPFSNDVVVYEVRRKLYKSLVGDRLIFEEVNKDLGLVFSFCWSTSDAFGFVKKTSVRNSGKEKVTVKVLDGIRNILPSGVSRDLQSRLSTLVDAYKKAELHGPTGAGIYSLSSIPSDRAEPNESLKASVAWCSGIRNPEVLLSEKQVEDFCAGLPVRSESVLNGQRGAYFVQTEFTIRPDGEADWYLMADTGCGPSDLPLLLDRIARGISADDIEADIEAGTTRLMHLVGSADGFQATSGELESGRHFANTLFNIMRGGIFADQYRIHHCDFLQFVTTWNAPLRDRFSDLLASKADPLSRSSLLEAVDASGDAHMKRLALEYLPLTFSRRHGDPSRPWNKFSIDIRNPDGTEKLHYQGNWRDIFQNWEALAISFPEFIDSFITKFVNASTVDGFNPYRIGNDGFEWEELDPEDSWSNIGYWGDHQVNYLLSLLEFSQRYYPGQMAQLLDQDLFVYSDVPYRLKNYRALLDNPRESIDFDRERAQRVAERVERIGADGKLVTLADGSIYRVNLIEKLLVTVLGKVGSLVPGGGIWMNTQRPEWNDANNALAGYGLSMVTLSYLRRFLQSLEGFVRAAAADSFLVSEEVAQFFHRCQQVLSDAVAGIDETTSDRGRKVFMDRIGACASDYRERVYAGFTGERSGLEKEELLAFVDTILAHLDHTLGLSRRPDGFFNSYNTIRFCESAYRVGHLPEMLEGQVAVLNSCYLDPQESLDLLDVLKNSKLYCPGRNSYLLYPEKELPSFLEKNIVPKPVVEASDLLRDELASGRRTIVEQDVHGDVHFNSAFSNLADLHSAIGQAGDINSEGEAEWYEIFEQVFDHRGFSGRSSTMYKYEGIGCIYWHMVSKLLLAVSETIDRARDSGAEPGILNRLVGHFDNIREGLGLHKSPAEYGAIPLDPYSHTPRFTGAQQPGMTGQVKEDFITRFRELGVDVRAGVVFFDPHLLRLDEFVRDSERWQFPVDDNPQSGTIDGGFLVFSLCGTPVIYRLAGSGSVHVFADDDPPEIIQGASLGESWSRSLFRRENRIRRILVNIPESVLR